MTGKHLDDVNARTMHKSGSSQDYALIDMTASSMHNSGSMLVGSSHSGSVRNAVHHSPHSALRSAVHPTRTYSSDDVL